MILYHYTNVDNKDSILSNGLKACTRYAILSSIRENVVFCWLNKKDNKLLKPNEICFKVDVDADRCLIADMDYISIAMMYESGTGVNEIKGKPQNTEASNLLVQLYEITAVPPNKYYKGMHFSPEVLVKGDISASCIELC